MPTSHEKFSNVPINLMLSGVGSQRGLLTLYLTALPQCGHRPQSLQTQGSAHVGARCGGVGTARAFSLTVGAMPTEPHEPHEPHEVPQAKPSLHHSPAPQPLTRSSWPGPSACCLPSGSSLSFYY